MRWIREHRLVAFLVVVIIAAVSFLVYSAVTEGGGNAAGAGGSAVGRITAPVVRAAESISGGTKGIFQYRSLKKENEALKKENAELQQQIIDQKLTKSQLEELKNLKASLKYKGKSDSTSIVSGDVTSMDGTNWMNVMTIDIGTENGIEKGDIVVSGNGLVGKIRSTGHGWSKVVSVIDTTSHISFKDDRDMKILGLIQGTRDGSLTGYTLDNRAKIRKGDKLITSGMGVYPEGILIGTVTKVKYDDNVQLRKINVAPAVDFKSIQKVAVLR